MTSEEQKKLKEEFEKNFTHEVMWGSTEMVFLKEGSPDEVLFWFFSKIEEKEKEIVEKIKFHFETMIFDNTGEDKLANIMEFRKEQSRYLSSLTSKEEV